MTHVFKIQVSVNEFAQGLCILKCPDLLNIQINLALSNMFADKNGQINLERFVWAVAKPILQKLLSPISVEICAAFVEFLCLSSNDRIDRKTMTRVEASNVLRKIMKRGCMNDIHIRCSYFFAYLAFSPERLSLYLINYQV
jgi:hypothetical protein